MKNNTKMIWVPIYIFVCVLNEYVLYNIGRRYAYNYTAYIDATKILVILVLCIGRVQNFIINHNTYTSYYIHPVTLATAFVAILYEIYIM